jgi:hypothetical protein
MARLQMRALVALLGTLALGGCATATAGSAARSGAAAARLAVRVDNLSNERIDLCRRDAAAARRCPRLDGAWLAQP